MRRALIIGSGTVVGVAAVLGLNPDAAPTTSVAASSVAPAGTTNGSTSPHSPTKPPTGTGSTSGTGSSGSGSTGTRTVAGPSIDVGNGYGSVALDVTLTEGRIVDITALEIPQNEHRSYQISMRALPMLVKQAIAAQSSQISGVTGASYTTDGFVESLRAALVAAGHAA